MSQSRARVAAVIEHTLLRPEATSNDIDRLCEDAISYGFYGVCVSPTHVARAAARLHDTKVSVVAAVGFPAGADVTTIKCEEAGRAIEDGATEVDMVVNLEALLRVDEQGVRADIEAVARLVHACDRADAPPRSGRAGAARRGKRRRLKVILETAALQHEHVILGCRCCVEGGADFVKSSTGLHPAGGATVEAVRLLCRYASPLPVKASGGIRDAASALAMLEAGAARIGTSSGVSILRSLGQAASEAE